MATFDHISMEELYTTRLILLMETEPQSNEYRQVRLNEEQFRKMSDALADTFRDRSIPVSKAQAAIHGQPFFLPMGDDIIKLPDVPEVYENGKQ